MSPERWQQIEAVFQAAIDLTPKDRESYISEQCAGDEELKAEVLRLIVSDESAQNFIESPVWTDSSFLNSSAKRLISDSLDHQIDGSGNGDYIGRQIGAYRIVSEIGRGGMGAVYRAERADGEFSQKVAIKLIKRGMDSDFIIRRFRHERQILASFEHPFIARLLDGGTTKDGIPYFVMEFIEGETLYNYCDKNRLELRERLKIFQKICSALQYAHERQIVHRDIKPSNILINKFGSPKLLDFGIAKILDPNLIHESVNPTASLMRMMTPDYASPEQVEGLDVTPSSDIYSLGILLYELVTGHKPYNFAGRALHEVSRVICEVMPIPPSRIIERSENLLPQYLGSDARFADVRAATPSGLKQQLETNLDNIVMKALRKTPEERYASVKELSEDITRHLNGQIVSALAFIPKLAESPLAAHVSASSNAKALAVLPFKFLNLGPASDTDDRFLGMGLADALITRLSKVKRFVVRPTSSIRSFGDERVDPIRAGLDLKVDYIIDGNIKKAKDKIRVTVQLLKVADNAAVWAASIDEMLTDVFTLEDTISNKLIEVLLPQLTGNELAEFSKRGTEVPEAFEHYLRARYYFNSFTEDGLAKAFVSFHSAIAADPNYSHAYAGIADYYNWLGIIGVLPPQECYQPAIEAATKAVQLDENLSEAHASLGFSLHAGNYDWANAEHHLRRAIELNPGNANAYVWYSLVLFTEGRFTDGLEFARRSIDLDPLTPFNHHNIGWGLYYARRYEEGITQYRKVISDFPDYVFGYYGLSKIHRITGDTSEALRENARAMALMDNAIFSMLSEAECLAADGQTAAAKEKVAELETISETRYVSPYQLSLVYCYLGDTEKALDLLEKAEELKEAWLNWMGIEPVFDPIRDDERFRNIWERIGYFGLFANQPTRSVRSDGPDTQAVRQSGMHDLTTLVIPETGEANGPDQAAALVSRGREHASISRYVIATIFILLGIGTVVLLTQYFTPKPPVATADVRLQNPSIVVLPFQSTDESKADLGTGLADALSNKLGNIKSFQVIAANTGRAMASLSPSEIGRDFGVAFVLRGTLRPQGDNLSMHAELVRTADGVVVWSENFTAGEGDLFRMQTNLAERVWTSLGVEPLPLERQQVYRSYTQSDKAYRHYLVGRYQMASRTPESLRAAIETFSLSLKEDENFALAYVGMADCYSLLNLYDIQPPADAYLIAQRYALKALTIDTNLAEAHATLAYVKFFHERDWPGSELEFRRSLQVNPSYAQAHHWFALVLAGMGRTVEAISEAETGQRLDPRSAAVRSAKAMVHFFSRGYPMAITESDNSLAISPGFLPSLKVKRWVYTVTGDFAAAQEIFEKELGYSGGSANDPGWQIIAVQLTPPGKDNAAKLRVLETAIASPGVKDNDFAFAYEIALAYHALGRTEKALEWLERAEAARSHSFNFLAVDPRFGSLKGDPAFQRLLKKLNPLEF